MKHTNAFGQNYCEDKTQTVKVGYKFFDDKGLAEVLKVDNKKVYITEGYYHCGVDDWEFYGYRREFSRKQVSTFIRDTYGRRKRFKIVFVEG